MKRLMSLLTSYRLRRKNQNIRMPVTLKGLFGLAGILATILLTGCATRPPERPANLTRGDYSYVKAHMAWAIEREMRQHAVVGLSVALVDDQNVVWAQGFGYADKAGNIRATPDTVFRVGSVSKLFTTIAALQLAEQGRLSFSDPLRKAVPEFSLRTHAGIETDVTLHQLATHHAGLPRDLAQGMWGEQALPSSSLVGALQDQYMQMPPGYVFAYSNVGMSLLGEAVVRASGRPFAEHLNASVLAPLGMAHSGFSAQVPEDALMARSYQQGREQRDTALRDIAAGGLSSSVHDMSRFIEMVFARGRGNGTRILNEQSVDDMLRVQNAGVAMDLDLQIGLAWFLGDPELDYAGKVAGHGGDTDMFHASLVLLPEHQLGVIVMTNTDTGAGVVRKIATQTLQLALEAKTGISPPPTDAASPATGAPLTASERAEYLGWWTTETGAVQIVERGDTLWMRMGTTQLRLDRRADGRLSASYRLFGLFPVDSNELGALGFSVTRIDGAQRLIVTRAGRQVVFGTKLSQGRISEAWRARLGEYRLLNPSDPLEDLVQVRLLEEDGLLFVEMAEGDAPKRAILRPLGDDQALLLDRFAAYGITVEAVVRGGKEILSYSGLQFARRNDQGILHGQ
jgi:CubicO group peptidase (beta-lactamase class C family)